MFIGRVQYLLWLVSIGASPDGRSHREYVREMHELAAVLVAFWVFHMVMAILMHIGTVTPDRSGIYFFGLVRFVIGLTIALVVYALLKHRSSAWDVHDLSTRNVVDAVRLKSYVHWLTRLSVFLFVGSGVLWALWRV